MGSGRPGKNQDLEKILYETLEIAVETQNELSAACLSWRPGAPVSEQTESIHIAAQLSDYVFEMLHWVLAIRPVINGRMAYDELEEIEKFLSCSETELMKLRERNLLHPEKVLGLINICGQLLFRSAILHALVAKKVKESANHI